MRIKTYLCGGLILCLLLSCQQPVRQVVTPVLSTKPFQMNEVIVTKGPFKHAEEKEVAYLLELEPDRFLSGFRSEAGLTPKAPKYEGWESLGVAGHTLGHYLSACARYYATSGDKRFKQRLDYAVNQLDSCQKANGNGYLAATPGGKKIFEEVAAGKIYSQGFDLNGGWVPLYVMHKVLAGLIDTYQYAGNEQALMVAEKLAGWMHRTFSHLTEEQMQQVLACEFGGMNEALADLYVYTKDEKTLALARRFDNHKVIMDSLALGVDALEGKHANTQVPKVIGAARLYELTGSKRDSAIATFFWHTVVTNHSYVNGGNSDGEHFGLPGKLNERLSTSNTETCNTYNMLKLTRHLFAWQSLPEYSAYYERAVFNHILASQNPDDGMCTYYTPLISGGKKEYLSPFRSFCCCSGSGMENHVKYGDFIYSEGSDSSLFVNLFIPSQLKWTNRKMVIVQDTDIPASDKTILTVQTEQPQTVVFRLRYPEWAESMSVKVNERAVSLKTSGHGYVSIEREWEDDDRVEITFRIKFYTVAMPDNDKRIGLFYGPVLLAGELGKEEPDMEKDIPVLVTNHKPVEKWLEKVSDSPLRFQTKGVGEPEDVSLIPFHAMHHQHYAVYWDLFTTEEWKDMQEAYKKELKRLQELDKITVDYITLGEMQPERDHNLRGENIGNGISHRKKWRAAWIGGWFEFDMKVLPDVPQNLRVTYWGGETEHLEFDIYVDGKVLVRQQLYQNSPGHFFEAEYPLPEHLLRGKEKITIRFKGVPGSWTGAVYNVRIAKHE